MSLLSVAWAAAALSVAAPALPHPSHQAAPLREASVRIREIAYAPGAVYPVESGFRTATQIVFSPEETIRHAAIGDSLAWEVAAEGSVLFLKPRERHGPTNLLVVTERQDGLRHYVFDLTARDRGGIFQLRFLYPDDERIRSETALSAVAAAAADHLLRLELAQGAVEGPRNLAYSVQGDPALQPSEITDNGRFTVLRFPGGQPIPAIFEVEGQTERLVPYDVRGEFVVLHGVMRGLRLRRGPSVLCVFNDAFDDRAAATGTGTASRLVERRPFGEGS